MALTADYNIGYADGSKDARPRYETYEYMRGYKEARLNRPVKKTGYFVGTIMGILKTPRQLICFYECPHCTHFGEGLGLCTKADCRAFMDRNRRDGDKTN